MTNREFAESNQVFKLACQLANTPPTLRQASKFRLGKGIAFTKKDKAIRTIEAQKAKTA